MAQTPSVKFLDDPVSPSAKHHEKMAGSPSQVLEFSSRKGEVFNITPRKGEYFKHASASRERLETLTRRTKSKTQKSKSDASKHHCACKSHDHKCACACLDDSLTSTPKLPKQTDQRMVDYERMKMLTDVNAVLSVVLSTVMVLARRIDAANMKDHLTWTLRFLENVKDDQGQAPNNIKVIMELIEDRKKQDQASNEEDKNKKK